MSYKATKTDVEAMSQSSGKVKTGANVDPKLRRRHRGPHRGLARKEVGKLSIKLKLIIKKQGDQAI